MKGTSIPKEIYKGRYSTAVLFILSNSTSRNVPPWNKRSLFRWKSRREPKVSKQPHLSVERYTRSFPLSLFVIIPSSQADCWFIKIKSRFRLNSKTKRRRKRSKQNYFLACKSKLKVRDPGISGGPITPLNNCPNLQVVVNEYRG